MDVLDWIEANRPGTVQRFEWGIKITHQNGDTSHLWYRDPALPIPEALRRLQDVYSRFDGCDLFSSSFKIAAISTPRSVGSLEIVQSLRTLAEDIENAGISFPARAVPFLERAGVGVYASSESSDTIFEWDTVEQTLSSRHESVTAILDEWFLAVGDIVEPEP